MEGNGSEGTTSVTNEGSANSGEGSVSVEALQEQLNALRQTNERLLKESKTSKEKYKQAEEKLSQFELHADGERTEAAKPSPIKQADFWKKETEKLKSELERTKKTTLKAQIRSKIAQYAPDAIDLDDVLNQPKFVSILEGGIDEDSLSLADDSAKAYVAELRKAKSNLFKAGSNVGVVNKTPRNTAQNLNGKGFKDLSNEQLMELALMGKL